mmetsp:Transcript_9586/g.31851  ORF Transcript_9586/g.31851 Transcript_9586/m.31851 type:complete len:236 (-) Transcript_9586:50-757(-)
MPFPCHVPTTCTPPLRRLLMSHPCTTYGATEPERLGVCACALNMCQWLPWDAWACISRPRNTMGSARSGGTFLRNGSVGVREIGRCAIGVPDADANAVLAVAVGGLRACSTMLLCTSSAGVPPCVLRQRQRHSWRPRRRADAVKPSRSVPPLSLAQCATIRSSTGRAYDERFDMMLQSYSTQNGSRIAVNASMVNAMHAPPPEPRVFPTLPMIEAAKGFKKVMKAGKLGSLASSG